jgi:hypothetical protein
MNEKGKHPQEKPKFLQSHDPFPKMALQELSRLFKAEFSLNITPDSTKPYMVRITDALDNAFHPDCRSLCVMAHNRGTRIAPYHIKEILRKFEITEEEFRAAYNRFNEWPVDVDGPSHDEPPKIN